MKCLPTLRAAKYFSWIGIFVLQPDIPLECRIFFVLVKIDLFKQIYSSYRKDLYVFDVIYYDARCSAVHIVDFRLESICPWLF